MNKLLSKLNRLDIGICLISVMIYVGIANAPFKSKPFGDFDFHVEAKTIALFLWGQKNYDVISITKAPGPVLFYITPYFLAGPNASDNQYWLSGILWNGVFMTMALFLIRASCQNFGSERAANISVLLIFILPLQVYYSLGILAEGPAFLGCSLMVYGYSRIYAKKQRNSWIIFGGGVLLLALARPNAILVLPLLLLFALWERFIRKDDFFSKIWKKILVTLVVTSMMVMLVTVFVKELPNKRQTIKQEGYLGYVALIGRYQFREETWDWRFWDSDIRSDSKDYQHWKQKLSELNSPKEGKTIEQQYFNFLVQDILEHPLISIKQFFVRAIFGHTLQVSSVSKDKFGVGSLKGTWFYWLFHLSLNFLNLSLLIMSVLFLIRNGGFHKFGILVMPWAALVFFHGIIYMEQRYLFPARPMMIVLSSLFIANYLPITFTFGKFKWKT